ncbi:hypothetical protein [Thauera linaloolentis]|uniref:Lipoprotein n=1 Tax=Thauera linaloolentis (strain DSM 12138 / JCM 21573 / CCUG 41526 / CIP 105981 / IAM 15112 / NBRC 102519 / 47Lol) TaxID=1123367 RepID=N6Y2H5_THAL4|nr:hypothetical protein [Thauera linaloolentis]ENO85745.1 hypothetical protein C666_14710 [Thauera linaloolentis 47Lol = DSM 12138]MCM8564185.1 hypothetical protein [Thauera linaloolentis]
MRIARLRRVLMALALLPVLAACENSATAYMVDGKDHALVLVREQKFFWDGELKQAVIASRLPKCQKRVSIHPGSTTLVEMRVYEAGDLLWALQQGPHWYLASTEVCRVQDWDNASGQPPGRLVGSFTLRDGAPVFVAAPADGG